MINKGKLDFIPFNYRISTTTEQKLCNTCRELIGFLNSLIKYDNDIIGCEVTINVWKDYKPIFSCFAEKGNLSPKIIFAQMQSNKFKKLHIIYTKEKSFR